MPADPGLPTTDRAEWTPEQLADMARVLSDPDAAMAALPEAERLEYERCKQSVIDARRAGGRIAHELWIA